MNLRAVLTRLAPCAILLWWTPTICADDVVSETFGPGMAGTLAPLDETPLRLVGEFGTITLQETSVSLDMEYHVANYSAQEADTRVGVPAWLAADEPSTPKNVRATMDGVAVSPAWEDSGRYPPVSYNFRPYVPFDRQTDRRQGWLSWRIRLAPQQSVTVRIRWDVDYLWHREILKGRREESARLFRYVRSPAAGWNGPLERSVVYLKSQVKQPRELAVTPLGRGDSNFLAKNEIDRRRPTAKDDIVAIYDPVRFGVTPYGLRGQPAPETLASAGNASFGFDNMFDGDPTTAWCEGERGGAEGKSFEVEWGKYRSVKSVTIVPGLAAGRAAFYGKNRLKTINLYLSKPGWISEAIPVTFDDQPSRKTIPLDPREKATMLLLQIREIYPGASNDTCIAELQPEFATPPSP